MILEVYISLALIGFGLLAAGIIKKEFVLCLIAAVVFIPLALGSADFDYIDCVYSVQNFTSIDENLTTVSTGINCTEYQLTYFEMVWFFWSMVGVSSIIALIYLMLRIREELS